MSGYGDISLWMGSLAETVAPRPALDRDVDVDVAIIGGGYTGLWTAYYLKTLAPQLSVAVLEAHVCGFGASGRNGGWLMGALEGGTKLLSGLDGEARKLARDNITGLVDAVDLVLKTHNLDCDFHRGGGIYAAARYPEQLARQRHELETFQACGYSQDDYRWLEADELAQRLQIRKPLGAIYTPHVARIHPARLVRQLADLVEQLGVTVYEQSRVTDLGQGELRTDRARVRAGTRVMAMEGFAYELLSHRRRVLPVQSMIVATEPLDEALWQQIGLAHNEVFCDASPLVTYGQRTADNRIVFGSRGGYRFGGKPRSGFTSAGKTFDHIHDLLLDCLPQLAGVGISHRWGGTLGVPRAFCPHAIHDPESGLATAGGYLGEGVGAANLMARTLVDQILDRRTELTTMPWAHKGEVNAFLRRWEPEPLRWLGFKAITLSAGVEEAFCRRQSPDWQRAIAQRVSAMANRLRG